VISRLSVYASCLLKGLRIHIATRSRRYTFRMRTDKTDRHVAEVLRPKPDFQAWNILCETNRHDDPAIKNIADESTVHV
jgi:hypothetical protein